MAVGETIDRGASGALARSRRPLREASHLPSHVYTSRELFAREKDEIFMRDWLAVARVEEIAAPGDYMTFDIMGEPIVLTRDGDGEIHAFYNLCAHRGVEVVAGAGNARQFKCPYHAWTYDLGGKLLGAAYMDDIAGFDRDACRMRPIAAEVWEGWVFVNFDDEAGPLADFVADFARHFGVFQQGRCRLTRKLTTSLKCNWKLVNENLVDVYHLITLHGDTLTEWPTPETYNCETWDNGGYAAFYDNHMSTLAGLHEFGPAPWLADWLADKDVRLAAGAGFLSPNLTTFVRPYTVADIIIWPVAVDETLIHQYLTVPAHYFDAADDVVERAEPIHRQLEIVLEEDRTMIESLQRSMHTRGFRPGRMSTSEFLVHNYVGAYLERMFGADGARQAAE